MRFYFLVSLKIMNILIAQSFLVLFNDLYIVKYLQHLFNKTKLINKRNNVLPYTTLMKKFSNFFCSLGHPVVTFSGLQETPVAQFLYIFESQQIQYQISKIVQKFENTNNSLIFGIYSSSAHRCQCRNFKKRINQKKIQFFEK